MNSVILAVSALVIHDAFLCLRLPSFVFSVARLPQSSVMLPWCSIGCRRIFGLLLTSLFSASLCRALPLVAGLSAHSLSLFPETSVVWAPVGLTRFIGSFFQILRSVPCSSLYIEGISRLSRINYSFIFSSRHGSSLLFPITASNINLCIRILTESFVLTTAFTASCHLPSPSDPDQIHANCC